MNDFHALTLSAVDTLTPNAVALSFEIPEALKDVFSFKAGQYITLKQEIDGHEVRRAYSISSAPHSNTLTVGIKKVPNGTFSTFANDKLNAGDSLQVMPPDGRFIFDGTSGPAAIGAFAAGSGITPILSIAQTVLEAHPENKFVLVYGNTTLGETMFRKEIEALLQNYPNRFFVEWTFSRENVANALFGRIDNSTVNLIIKNKFKQLSLSKFYLCGPEEMIETVSNTLSKGGIAKDNILFELFTSSTPEATSVAEGTAQIVVVVDEETHSFTMNKKTIVLDAVLKQDIDAPYSCQGGVCSSCIARVTEGKAEMANNQILTDSEIEEGLILTCQAHAVSSSLKVDFDDV